MKYYQIMNVKYIKKHSAIITHLSKRLELIEKNAQGHGKEEYVLE